MKSRVWSPLVLLSFCLGTSISATAAADAKGDAKAFIEKEHAQLIETLKKRGNVDPILDTFVAYDDMTKATFGERCPHLKPKCVDYYTNLKPDEKAQLHELMRKYIRGTYRKNVAKTLEFNVNTTDVKELGNNLVRIRTEAKPKNDRGEIVQIDYVLTFRAGKWMVVDTITENSSLTKNLSDQFAKMMETDGQKFPHVVRKLEEKNAKLAAASK